MDDVEKNNIPYDHIQKKRKKMCVNDLVAELVTIQGEQ